MISHSLKFKSKIQQILVIVMFSALTQVFSSPAKAGGNVPVYPRQIDLSGNVLHFSMPEDFSKDMPAHDMVDTLDIGDSSKFDDPEYGNLIRRWWDIKQPGWFGRELGTVMVDISVQRVVRNQENHIHSDPYNIRNRMDFVLMLDDRYHQYYDALNAEIEPEPGAYTAYHSSFATVSGRKLYATWREFVVNHQKWIENSIAGPHGVLIIVMGLPITDRTFLDVTFTYSKNSNVLLREFVDVASSKMDVIKESLKVEYLPENEFGRIVSEDWQKDTSNELINQNYDAMLKLFYGPDAEATLLQMERESRESADRDEREMREALKHDPL